MVDIYPFPIIIDESIPDDAKYYLEQAVNSQQAPDGAIICSASSVDAMLKAIGYAKNLIPSSEIHTEI